jgi:exosortase family protein XrtF
LENYFKKYKPFLLFLGKFLLSYLTLIFFYQLYLNQFDATKFEVDGITQMVANHSGDVLNFFDYKITLQPHDSESSVRMYLNNVAIVRIVEGCNAVSVMILFTAFIIAFSGKLLQTTLYILFGVFIIHLLNVLRIALLTMGLIHYKAYEHLMHDIIFPLFIYGVVFGLWLIWVNKFSGYDKKTASK